MGVEVVDGVGHGDGDGVVVGSNFLSLEIAIISFNYFGCETDCT